MTPPRFPDRLLTWFCALHLREEVLGDLHDRYARRVARMSKARALTKTQGYAFINIGGLAVSIAVATLISLWIWDLQITYLFN